MAYHFRKLRNTLRLLPSAKTVGFSTRLNEGDSHNILPTSADGSQVTAQHGFSDLIMKHSVHSDMGKTNSDDVVGITRSQSHNDLGAQFLPTIISRPSSVIPLPVTYNDLAQILRLPMPASTDNDLCRDVVSALRVVYPSTDDILVELSHGLSDNAPCNRNLKDSSKYSFSCSSVDKISGKGPMDLLKDSYAVLRCQSQQLPTTAASTSTFTSTTAASQSVQSLTSHCDRDLYLSSCHLFSSTSPNKAEPQNLSSKNGSSHGKDGPSAEQMHKIKEKLEKAVCKMFSGRQDYSILHKNIVLENNLFGDNKTSVGLLAYGIEILKLRLRVHARFSNTSVELQSVTMLEQNGVIRIHWRLKGLSQIQTLKFWRLFQSRTPISKDDYEWVEAFSYFHIGKDGLVRKHRIDRMISDDSSGTEKITNTIRELLTPAKPLVS